MFKEVSPFLPKFDEAIDLIEKNVGCTYRLGINLSNNGKAQCQVMDFVDKSDPRRDEMRANVLASIEIYRKWQSGQHPLIGRYTDSCLTIRDYSGNVVAQLPPPYEFLPKRTDAVSGNPT